MGAAALVIGADGHTGGELLHRIQSNGWRALGTSRRPAAGSSLLQFDLTDPSSQLLDAPGVRDLQSADGWTAFMLAGVSGYKPCADNPERTRHINVTCSVRLVRAMVDTGALVVYPSSSAVFGDAPGTCSEDSAPSPNTEYGRQKAEAEAALLGLPPSAPGRPGVAAVRLSKVLGLSGLIDSWRTRLTSGQAIEAATNLSLSPISASFASHSLIQIARAGRSGVYHLTGDSVLTYFELALHLADAFGADRAQVQPVQPELTKPHRLASDAVLSMARTTKQLQISPQPLDSVIHDLTSSRVSAEAR